MSNNETEKELLNKIDSMKQLSKISGVFLEQLREFFLANNLPNIKKTYQLTHDDIDRFIKDNLKELRNRLAEARGE
jgi:hypothetical protein